MVAMSTLIGCGYKGDLYLPEPKPVETATPLPNISASATKTTKTDTPKVRRIIPE